MHVIIKRIFSNNNTLLYLLIPISRVCRTYGLYGQSFMKTKNFRGTAMPRYENPLTKPKCHFILFYIFFAKKSPFLGVCLVA